MKLLSKFGALAPSAIALTAVISPAKAQEETQNICPDPSALFCTIGDKVFYLPGFFDQYNPVTALDMVRRVPGFSIEPGDDVRGFGGAAGNVLIDGERPSTKSADLFQVLQRIGAGSIDYIELIRGGAGSLDTAGQSVVVNVVRNTGAGTRDAAPWEFSIVKRRPGGGVRPQGSVSYSDTFGKTKYTMGANIFGISLAFQSEENITRFSGLDETRNRNGNFREQGGGLNFKLERPFDNGDKAQITVEAEFFKWRETYNEARLIENGDASDAFFTFPFEDFNFEVGGDYEHGISENLDIKFIALFSREYQDRLIEFAVIDPPAPDERSLFATDREIGELIGRTELNFTGFDSHAMQFGGEIAKNFIDNSSVLSVADATGMLTPVDIAGVNTRVSELRGEVFVKNSWSLAPKLTVDLGFALEASRISQSGDNANSRDFLYPKPSLTVTYAANDKTQFRLAAEREVGQLDFGEFVSAVNFDDDDVDFGNPDLRPQRTWAFEASAERRFGDIGVVKLTGFYDHVQDVEDLLPIGGVVEVPGNIGDGKVYGAVIDVTTPLAWFGLKNARLESSATIRDSSVIDPVTGYPREFSFMENTFYEIEFRQDFPAYKVSWGASTNNSSEEFGFGLDEFSRFTRDQELTAFIETTAIDGVKVRFQVGDILNVTNVRDRTVFDGSRALNMPLFREVRRSNNGGNFILTLSGTF
ncbi:MAG: outer membrane beta-barrel protein [Marinicaulis sp.]|nr:outer membrane beta-barrel protein [Marinicaulis sp.]